MDFILDFDDTLAVGPNTWAFENVFPSLIREHNLPFDKEKFDEVMLTAQKDANEGISEEDLLNSIFTTLGWKDELKSELVNRTFNEYQPILFDDTPAFLNKLKNKGVATYMISNNDHATRLCEMLGIKHYFVAIITPKISTSRAKPYRDMYDQLIKRAELGHDIYMVGDDPWSDGSFAKACGIKCYIVDRLQRYESLYSNSNYTFVKSLSEIEVHSSK